MDELPDLSKLTDAEKDQLLSLLWEQCRLLRAQIPQLETQIKGLKDRLSKNSQNSSKPPSSDHGSRPNPKSRRKNSGKKAGGQKGHVGHRLNPTDTPDYIVEYSVNHCEHCGENLEKVAGEYDRRQVFDIPILRVEVTEHRVQRKMCACCGYETQGDLPKSINQLTQYGHRIKALMVYMNQYQLLPFHRLNDFFKDVFHQRISVGTFVNAKQHAYKKLSLMEEQIRNLLKAGKKLHVDETSLRVMKQRNWLHVASTNQLTCYDIHTKRGTEALDEIGLLPDFKGILVHDHFKPYFHYGSGHSLCNAHHLRELTFVQEQENQQWAKKLEKLLLNLKHKVEIHYQKTLTRLPDRILRGTRSRYMGILYRGRTECPAAIDEKKKGRQKQSTSRNLLERLRKFNQSVLAFMYDPALPFDNNQAERDIRMVKVQQKISGCYRSWQGIKAFCRIRGCLSTLRKNGLNLLTTLENAIQASSAIPLPQLRAE
jgi:transposase